MKFRQTLWRYKGPVLILLAVIFANILYISGIFKANPADIYSGLDINTKVGLITSAQPTIDPNNAYTTQALGHAAARNLAHGKSVWWNYNEQVGAPLAGEMQSAALFVPFNLLLHFADGVLMFHFILELLAGLATYVLLKRLKLGEAVATTGGVLFAVNGTFAWLTNAAFNPVAFLPCLLLGVELIFSKSNKDRRVGQLVVAVSLAYSLYAGFPETALLEGLLVAVWSICRLWQHREKDLQSHVKTLALGVVVGLLLAAPILIAFKAYYPYADVGGHNGAIGSYAALPGSSLASLFMPYIYGPIFAFTSFDKSGALIQFWDNVGGYLSFSLLFLAIVGLISSKEKLLSRILGLWVLLTIARTYGFPGIAKLINLIPGLSDVAFYRYVPPSFELAVVILAMMGLDQLIKGKVKVKKILYSAGGISALALGLIIVGYHESHKLYLAPHHRLWFAFAVVVSLVSFATIVITSISFKKYAKLVIPAVIVAEALVIFMIPNLSSPRSTTLDTAPVSYLQHNLDTSRFFSLGPIMPNYSSYYNIAAINTNNLPIAKNWSNYITSKLDSNVTTIGGFTGVNETSPIGPTPLQAFLKNMPNYEEIGVKYVLAFKQTITPQQAASSNLKSVFSDGIYEIYKLPSPKPYYQILKGDCTLTSEALSSANVNCKDPATLEIRELYMPGWTASAGSKQVIVKQYGPLFQQLNLPKGSYKLSTSFKPIHIELGEIVLVVGLIGLVAIGFRAINQKD